MPLRLAEAAKMQRIALFNPNAVNTIQRIMPAPAPRHANALCLKP